MVKNGRDSPSSGHTSRNLNQNGLREEELNQNLRKYATTKSLKREDDWEKISRISRCTSQNKQPIALDGINDSLSKLHTIQSGLKRQKSSKSIHEKQQLHEIFIDQQIPLSERNEVKSEHSLLRFNRQPQGQNPPNTDRDRRSPE